MGISCYLYPPDEPAIAGKTNDVVCATRHCIEAAIRRMREKNIFIHSACAQPVRGSECKVTANAGAIKGQVNSRAAVLSGSMDLRHCTIVRNVGDGAGGGVYLQSSAIVRLERSIVAGNTALSQVDIFKNGGTLTAVGPSLIGSNQTVATQFPAGHTPALVAGL